jgi:diguanylate cyclase (GGDEF)-like protein
VPKPAGLNRWSTAVPWHINIDGQEKKLPMDATVGNRFHDLKAAGELPSPTGVALALLELTQKDDASIKEIVGVIQTDPALTGRLLKFANSGFVGLRRAVVSIQDAVILLGVHVVRQLTLGLSVLSNSRQGPCQGFDYIGFWSRSLATALASQALCEKSRSFPPEEAFTCGLLSQVGCLAMASLYPESYGTLQHRAANAIELTRLERSTLSVDHIELTVALLGDWGLPRVHLDAVREHEQVIGNDNLPKGSRERALAEILHMAAHIGRMCLAPDPEGAILLPQLITLGQQQGLSESDVGSLFDAVVRDWVEWGKLLEVPASKGVSFAEMVEQVRRIEATPSGEQHQGLRILVIDDDPVIVRRLTHHLEKDGQQVLTAVNGRAGLQVALEAKPQLVITDWMMPEMDGLALCRALRKARFGQLLYIIMLTMQEDEGHLVTAFDAGADDYVVKPYSRRVLEARIRGGERLIRLQQEIECEKEDNRRYLAELSVMNQRLREAALTDPLTELPNRRYAMEHVLMEWAASERGGFPLACLMVDVDHFKRFNDYCGHDVGDKVLRDTAAVLRGAARTNDLACRFGGEEFVVICANTDVASANQLAERLRRAVELYGKRVSVSGVSLTVSIGVAVRRSEMKSSTELLKAADHALLKAKSSGRNRVCVANAERA